MATKTLKRVYLSAEEIKNTFCDVKTADNELTALDLFGNLITPDVAMAFNDKFGMIRFRAIQIESVNVGTREEISTGKKVGSIIADFTVLAEDVDSDEIIKEESTGMFSVYRIGKIIMAEFAAPDTVYFGAFVRDKIVNGEVALDDIFGVDDDEDYDIDDDEQEDEDEEQSNLYYVWLYEGGDDEKIKGSFIDYDDAVAFANDFVKDCDVVGKFVDDGNYIWNMKKGERIAIVRNGDNEDLYMTDIYKVK